MLLCVLLGVCRVSPIHTAGYSKIVAHIQLNVKQQLPGDQFGFVLGVWMDVGIETELVPVCWEESQGTEKF